MFRSMWKNNIEKAYPELKGFPYNVQLKIIEKARHEIFDKENSSLFWRTPIPLLVLVLIVTIGFFILCLISSLFELKTNWLFLASPIIGVLWASVVGRQKQILLKPKVRELVQNDKI